MKNKIFTFVITTSILIVALSIAYYLVIFLPAKENTRLELEKKRSDEKIEELINAVRQQRIINAEEKTEEKSPQKVNTLQLLNQCLNVAKSEKERVTTELLKFAEAENKSGQYDLSGAFDSIEKQYEQDRQVCFAKYPQK
jgi:hypothetical protein